MRNDGCYGCQTSMAPHVLNDINNLAPGAKWGAKPEMAPVKNRLKSTGAKVPRVPPLRGYHFLAPQGASPKLLALTWGQLPVKQETEKGKEKCTIDTKHRSVDLMIFSSQTSSAMQVRR